MGFDLTVSIPALTVFLQGLLSFFSPCVLPLIPLYFGYLSGGAAAEGEGGRFSRGKVLVNTVFFVLGVSFAFFLLGLGMTALGSFLGRHQTTLARVGGVVVIFFGLYQLGLFGGSILDREARFRLPLQKLAMSPLTALLMGFVFSFAWTPCVGPALSSVLLMAASAASATPVPFSAEISTTSQPKRADSSSVLIRSPLFLTTSIMLRAITTGMPSSVSCVVR